MDSLNEGVVYVREGRLDASPAILAQARALLSREELTRADRFVAPRHRRRFAMARAQLRRVVGHVTGTPAGDVRFTYAGQGKPLLDGGPSFNLSHSREGVMIAVAREGRLGVDIEHNRQLRDLEGLAARYFAPDETARLRVVARPDRPPTFFRIWTRKEAFLKALGGGLAIPLKSFSVDPGPATQQCLLRVEGLGEDLAEWHVRGVDCAPGFTAAIAMDRTEVTIAPLGFDPRDGWSG